MIQHISSTRRQDKISLQINGNLIEYTVTRKIFENIVDPLISRTIDIVRKLLKEHNDIKVEYILLVGGSSLIYRVKECLEDEFSNDNIKVLNSVDPLTAVCIGASQKSFFEFVKHNTETRRIIPKSFPKQMIESVSITYGYLCYENLLNEYSYYPMIKKGSKLPTEPVINIATTQFDNQKEILMAVLQGESYEDSKEIGRYIITGLTGKMKAREESVRVTFQVDEQNCLHMTFELLDVEGGKVQTMDLDVSKFLPRVEAENKLTNMTPEQIEESRARIGVNQRNLDEELGELEDSFKKYLKKAKNQSNTKAIEICKENLNLIEEAFVAEDEDSMKKYADKIKQSLISFERQYRDLCH
ncbi:hypothetical protein TVAG_140390 [Trichomonas vaginalis G3]|uniref:DnaK protein n=1 Tax=Trichomonas vaginalis (strain ATCC PRA-98 / G3) TaxID=412133 RepID=A2EJS7_TRIV3|nr:ATP binding [Trichomonas vaginalis G3]EAY07065.1 hypothetical protein TVAG_140390 [Trichomonas vaginalis G3]KAI5535261.1 ATP binding [Trichomonas vaginalis G3]|eukprot:XP_001319288.1 hypothetical protein [Trichomonas vaginalis G3]